MSVIATMIAGLIATMIAGLIALAITTSSKSTRQTLVPAAAQSNTMTISAHRSGKESMAIRLTRTKMTSLMVDKAVTVELEGGFPSDISLLVVQSKGSPEIGYGIR
jgi:Na+-translocating ferredoxin:NAD+ oxidoreductase RnfG subunit